MHEMEKIFKYFEILVIFHFGKFQALNLKFKQRIVPVIITVCEIISPTSTLGTET